MRPVVSSINRYAYLGSRINIHYKSLLFLSFIAGCIAANEIPEVLYLKPLWIGVVLVSVIKPKTILCIVFLLLGAARVVFLNTDSVNHISFYTDRDVTVRAIVSAYPASKGLEKTLVLKPYELSLDGKNVPIKHGYIQGKISKYIAVNKGDKIEFNTFLEKPQNFEEFNYVEYLKSNNIYATAKGFKELKITDSSNRLDKIVNDIRTSIVTRINKGLPDPHAKLLAGMLIGTREQFSTDFANNLSITGTTHVIAVSGYNISLVITSILSLSGFVNRKTLLYLSYVGLIIFLLIVGIDNLPAFRAGIMGFVTLTALLTGRKTTGVFALSMVAALLHLQNPFSYKSLSFQLSFAATAGLMVLSRNISMLLKNILPSFIKEEFSTTLTALIVTFPITFGNFGKLALYALFTNLLIAPLIPFITFSGISWLILDSLNNTLGFLIKGFVWAALELMVRIVDYIAALPKADITYTQETTKFVIASIILIILFLFESSYRNYLSRND